MEAENIAGVVMKLIYTEVLNRGCTFLLPGGFENAQASHQINAMRIFESGTQESVVRKAPQVILIFSQG